MLLSLLFFLTLLEVPNYWWVLFRDSRILWSRINAKPLMLPHANISDRSSSFANARILFVILVKLFVRLLLLSNFLLLVTVSQLANS